MKRIILILTVLLLCLGVTGTVLAEAVCNRDNPHFLWYVAEAKDAIVTLAPITVTESSMGRILLTTSATYSAKKTLDGNDMLPPDGNDMLPPDQFDFVLCKIYNVEDPLKEVTNAVHFGGRDTPPDWVWERYGGRVKIDSSGQWVIDLPVLPIGKYRLDFELIGQKEVRPGGDVCINYRWFQVKGSQTFVTTVEPFSGGAPTISGVFVDPSGDSFTLTISGNNFGPGTCGVSLYLKAIKRALLMRGRLTVSTWKNKEVVCKVAKNPKANPRRRTRYRLYLYNCREEVEYIFRYP